MANVVYPLFKQNMLAPASGVGTAVDLSTAVLKAVLITTTTGSTNNYVYAATHEFLPAIAGSSVSSVLAAGVALTTKTFANGVLNAASVAFPVVAAQASPNAASTAQAIVLYVDTGTAATSQLVAYFDTGITGVPTGGVVLNGGQITINWDTGANKIFAL